MQPVRIIPHLLRVLQCLTLDGVGEWTTTSLAIGKGSDFKVVKEIHFPHSLGFFTLHSLTTQDLKSILANIKLWV